MSVIHSVLQHPAGAPDGLDKLLVKAGVHLFAKVADIDVDDVRPALIVIVP